MKSTKFTIVFGVAVNLIIFLSEDLKNERIKTIGFPLKTHISPFFDTHSDGVLLANSADTAGWKSSLSEKPRQHPECRTKKNIFTYLLLSVFYLLTQRYEEKLEVW